MPLLSVSDAYATIMAHAPSPVAESIDLATATGRFLLEPVRADRDYPPINRATMDGIAFSIESWTAGIRSWNIEHIAAAGALSRPLRDTLHGCVHIMTGAEVPYGCSGILPVEWVLLQGDMALARDEATFTEGQFVHLKASDRTAGDLILSPGAVIDAPRMAILAAAGHTPVTVARLPRVAVISTGNEIVPVNQRGLSPVQSRASNAAALLAALAQLGIHDAHAIHLVDDLAITTSRIAEALRSHDILILTGGVSKGQYDFVPAALEQSGASPIFHGIAQKPGKPFWFGQSPTATVFGLPGNPVSTLTVFRRFVAPFIRKVLGHAVETPRFVRLNKPIQPHPALTLFPPVQVSAFGEAQSVEYHGSGDFAALAESHGFVEILPSSTTGTNVPFWAW
jgi:molybdopterin molybdotransferase